MRTEWSDRFRAAAVAVAASLWAAVFGLLGSGLGQLGTHWSPVLPALVGPAAGVAFGWPAFRSGRPAVAAHRVATWCAVAGWVAWVYAAGVDHLIVWQVWGYGSLGLALVALPFAVPDAMPGFLPGAVAGRGIGDADWADRLARVAKVAGCTITGRSPWPGKAGYDVVGDCPDDGTSWYDLKERERALAASLRLPRGCGVEVGPGSDSRGFVVRVSTKDTLGEVRVYDDTSESSILRPVGFGWHRDGSPAQALLREHSVLCVAQVGGGKSNFLHTLTAGLVRCPDVLVWHIDLGGAGLGLPWVAPWLDGETDRPVVDWVAPDVREALVMTRFALQVIRQRRVAYRQEMRRADSDLIPVSPALPQIEVVIDETAEAAGTTANQELAGNIVRIAQLGRAVGVRLVLSGLRAVATVLPTDAQQQIGVRALFGVADESEVGHAMGWRKRLDLGEAPYPGSGWWRAGAAGAIRVFRTPHTARPSTIAAVAAATAGLRPVLDGRSHEGGDGSLAAAYVTRWERSVPLLTGDGDATVPAAVASRAATATATGGAAVRQSHPMTTGGGAGGYDPAEVQRKIEIARRAVHREKLDGMPAWYRDQEWDRMHSELEDERARGETPPAGRVDPRARMRELLDAAGAEGVSGPRLLEQLEAEGLSVPRSTLYAWLKNDAVDAGYGRWKPPFRGGR